MPSPSPDPPPWAAEIAAAAAGRGVPVQAEMGGKNAAVVLDDADFDLAVEQVMLGAFRSTGQKCTATSRLVLTEAIADRFLDALLTRANALDGRGSGRRADPDGAGDQCLGAARDHRGRRPRTGPGRGGTGRRGRLQRRATGRGPLRGADGHRTPRTGRRLGSTSCSARCSPSAEPATPRRPSHWPTTASSGCRRRCSPRISPAHCRRSSRIDVGVLHINSESAGADPHVPFGGARKSGLGPKEQGSAAREFFTHTTTVYLRGGEPRS